MSLQKHPAKFNVSPFVLIFASLIISALFGNKHVFMGVHLPGDIALRINNQLAGIFFILAVWLFFSRRKSIEKLLKGVLIAVALALLSVGVNYATLGVGPGQSFQDDGFNLTGGVLMLLSGLLGGYLLGRDKASLQPAEAPEKVKK